MEYEGQTLESYMRSPSRQKAVETSNMNAGGTTEEGNADEMDGMSLERYMWTGTPKESSLFNIDTSTVLFPLKKNRPKKDGTPSRRHRTPRSASRKQRNAAEKKRLKAMGDIMTDNAMAMGDIQPGDITVPLNRTGKLDQLSDAKFERCVSPRNSTHLHPSHRPVQSRGSMVHRAPQIGDSQWNGPRPMTEGQSNRPASRRFATPCRDARRNLTTAQRALDRGKESRMDLDNGEQQFRRAEARQKEAQDKAKYDDDEEEEEEKEDFNGSGNSMRGVHHMQSEGKESEEKEDSYWRESKQKGDADFSSARRSSFSRKAEKHTSFKLDSDSVHSVRDSSSRRGERDSSSRRGNRNSRSRQSRSRHTHKERQSGSRRGNREYRENRSRQKSTHTQTHSTKGHAEMSMARLGGGSDLAPIWDSSEPSNSKFPPIRATTPDLGRSIAGLQLQKA